MTTTNNCRSCGAPIVWVKMKNTGKAMPCDPKLLTVITPEGMNLSGRLSHFGSCPQAKEWSKPK